MEVIRIRYQGVIESLKTLKNGLAKLEKESQSDLQTRDNEMYGLLCDGVIQRFEYSLDTFWKFLKIYLESYLKTPIEGNSPRLVFRTALQSQLINLQELEILLDSLGDRNLTSHTYNQVVAQEVRSHLLLYCMTMQTITARFDHLLS
ncbi:MAG: HI0074 family nucleotidyltransferase substrate-binding subunit [Candidatus Chromulinivorax sp.]|nr:HI0074 family nucleotidyltransferase substrate-binding subunit [Candidatus Chromulinivorax sp.]